ncbi:hypothetical protein BJ508DRAFT_92356 [Ascobolus immersus RN42]|uniref:Transmembrane protein n=1 Tax=Ascobolus immersus RN42 TaxID=1160509 RepID=A0A3N4IKI7_ASCIM|nr:hypothetical protein BJ508DRAFT_92356 [Ascobolus immersus RN42]
MSKLITLLRFLCTSSTALLLSFSIIDILHLGLSVFLVLRHLRFLSLWACWSLLGSLCASFRWFLCWSCFGAFIPFRAFRFGLGLLCRFPRAPSVFDRLVRELGYGDTLATRRS